MIKVKFICNDVSEYYRAQLPDQHPRWGECQFIFDDDNNDYDWLVIYDDVPATIENGKKIPGKIDLCCAPAHTILVTMEPSNIKIYGQYFVEQFGHVLTSQEFSALRHPHRVFSQPALRWFFGRGPKNIMTFDQLQTADSYPKSKIMASVCSTKQQKHTLHYKRYHFIQHIKQQFPDMDLFGHGVREMDDKAEALSDYKYHIAIENHYAIHHWTEKLSDPYLAYCLPIYYGCPNIDDYFPKDSYIAIDINDPQGACEIIKKAIQNNEYEKRLPAIRQAREKVLNQYNLFNVLNNIVTQHHTESAQAEKNKELLSRHAARKRYPMRGLRDLLKKAKVQIKNRFLNY
ncbi:hypothetical protein MNBD_GAMMA12-1944 [hydrothermal vent metagenome]|uniref:Fucosyltransferase C-terminal domain-containing protein n=1 Tax=hydrothermal vent metagenome TaxID=652676 RepID=A0A3B0YLT9_9ZZZZ